MKHILLYEPNQEKISHTVFLLNLADINCTVIGTIEEAYNWLSTDQQKQVKFDLFLLGSLTGNELEKKLLTKIAGLTPVPIIYIKQNEIDINEAIMGKIIVCQPHNLLNCLIDCFRNSNSKPKLEIDY